MLVCSSKLPLSIISYAAAFRYRQLYLVHATIIHTDHYINNQYDVKFLILENLCVRHKNDESRVVHIGWLVSDSGDRQISLFGMFPSR